MHKKQNLTSKSLLWILFFLAGCLICRTTYLYLADSSRFPIQAIKVSATYEHISRHGLEQIIAPYLKDSIVTVRLSKLHQQLLALDWIEEATIKRIWPGTIKLLLKEKTPIANWQGGLITSQGDFIATNGQLVDGLPLLKGPENGYQQVLQMYEKFSKLLVSVGLTMSTLQLTSNRNWLIVLDNGIELKLGKQHMVERLKRFCQAYKQALSDKAEQLVSVDMRYSRGMAVQWQTEKKWQKS